jgi:hypothetical protein
VTNCSDAAPCELAFSMPVEVVHQQVDAITLPRVRTP